MSNQNITITIDDWCKATWDLEKEDVVITFTFGDKVTTHPMKINTIPGANKFELVLTLANQVRDTFFSSVR